MTAPLVFEPRPAGTIQKRNETIPSTGNRISLRGNRPALGAHVAEYDFIRQSDNRAIARVQSKMACFDYSRQRPVRLSENLKTYLQTPLFPLHPKEQP